MSATKALLKKGKSATMIAKDDETEDNVVAITNEPVAKVEDTVEDALGDEIATTKSKTKGKVKSKELDEIETLAFQIENLKESEAYNLANELNNSQGFNEFRLGGILCRMNDQNWFNGHANLKEMVETDYGFGYRTAMYLMAIYRGLVEMEISWNKVKHLGWTKLKELVRFMTQENADELIEEAANLNCKDLRQWLANKFQESSIVEEQAKNMFTNLSVKMTNEQKDNVKAAIDKIKAENNLEQDGYALELMAIESLSSVSKVKPAPLSTQLKLAGLDAVFAAFEKTFPFIDLSIEVDEEAAKEFYQDEEFPSTLSSLVSK